MTARCVVPSELEAWRRELAPRVLHTTGRMRSPEADAIARQWADYAARRADWLSAPDLLEHGRDLEARLTMLERSGQAAPATSHGITTPGDVLAYYKLWTPYVMNTAHAADAAADAWEATAAGQTPATRVDVSSFQTPPDPTTLRLFATTERDFATSIRSRWNAHANTPDFQLVAMAGEILQDFQAAVLRVGQFYQPHIRHDCPDLALPEPPSADLQTQVIAQIEGLGIVGHGVLQLLGIGADGVLDEAGAIASTAKKAVEGFAGALPAIAAAVVVVGLVVLVRK